jgi:DNA-directed RNA polymerase subunit M/transcription elongation factor TFIIS
MDLDNALDCICSRKENIAILKKLILEQSPIDPLDLVYEIGFSLKNGSSLKSCADLLRSGKIGLNHPHFEEISKRIEEMDHFMDKPFEVVEGVNSCGKCSSTRTLSYSRQTRSGDEGMTVYVFCVDCKFRYTMNS